jgi:hypothetical protein
MPKITMTKTALGQDVDAKGIHLPQREYVAGQSYVVHPDLANGFQQAGFAVPYAEPVAAPVEAPAPEPVEPTEAPAPPAPAQQRKRKGGKGAPENKGSR